MKVGIVFLSSLVLGALACGAPISPGESRLDQAPQVEAKRGGYLRHLLPYSSKNIDPYLTEDSTGYGFIVRQWYEPLLSRDYKPGVDHRIENTAIPWIAESWKQEGPRTYLFQIRRGVKFHGGEELTADDVVYSYGRFQDPNEKINPQVRNRAEPMESASKVDGYTVRITAKRPDPDFLETLTDHRFPIMSRSYAMSGADATSKANGTGPFKLVHYSKDVDALAVRNETYWQPGRPYLDGVKHTLRVDDSTMSAALAAGQADIMMRVDKNQFEPVLATNPKLQFRKEVVGSLYGVNLNVARPPLDDVRVRKAIWLVLDRQELDQALTFGEGTQSLPLVPPLKSDWSLPPEEIMKTPGYRQPKDQDIAEAKRLMREAGYPDGFRTTIMFPSGFGYQPQASEAVGEHLRRTLNIQADLQPRDNASLVQRRVKGEFDMVVEGSSSVDTPQVSAWNNLHSSGSYAQGAGIKDPEVDRLVGAQSTELDDKKRGAIFKELQRLLVERVYTIPLPQSLLYSVWQPWVYDWVSNKGNRQAIMNPWAIWMDVDQAPADRRGP